MIINSLMAHGMNRTELSKSSLLKQEHRKLIGMSQTSQKDLFHWRQLNNKHCKLCGLQYQQSFILIMKLLLGDYNL